MNRVIWTVTGKVQQYQRLLSLARDWRERWSVAGFLVHESWARLRKGEALTRDYRLDVQGARHFLAITRREPWVLEEIYIDRVYERLPDFVPRRGWTVVDLGANVGIFTVQQALRGARVHAVEPNPECYRRLRRAVEVNGLEDVVSTYPLAIGGGSGDATLVVGQSTLAGSLYHGGNEGSDAKRISVSMVTLDEAVERFHVRHIDMLKVDVERAEVDVLRGGRRTLRMTDRVIAECHSVELEQAVGDILVGAGFELRLRDQTSEDVGYSVVFYGRA